MNNSVQKKILRISHSSEVAEARRAARTMSVSLGFEEKICEEIRIVVSELASNIIKHAGEGTVTLSVITENGRSGMKIESNDSGPGIAETELVIKDGYSTKGSLGYGLGTVNRLMDEFNIKSNIGSDSGTYISCVRWLRNKKENVRNYDLDVGVATRMHPKMNVNGDAYVIKRWDEHLLIGIIDGLGHGQFAHIASEKARSYVETHFDQSFENLFLGVERACSVTRGVVMALANINCKDGDMIFASLGNIETKFSGRVEPMNFIIRRGIIGVKSVKPVITRNEWQKGSMMALYSDGIRSHWRWEDFTEFINEPSGIIAQKLLSSLARDNDDATIIIVKERSL